MLVVTEKTAVEYQTNTRKSTDCVRGDLDVAAGVKLASRSGEMVDEEFIFTPGM
mgnify:CR=1 FL=1